jgi:hypothetical protein
MLHRPCVCLLALSGAFLAALPATSTAGGSAHTARTCAVPKYPGAGYFTSLQVKHVTCATGRKVAIAYYHCRTRNGVAGHCRSRVLGYTCHETRMSIPTEIDARVACRRGERRVIHTYQQDT